METEELTIKLPVGTDETPGDVQTLLGVRPRVRVAAPQDRHQAALEDAIVRSGDLIEVRFRNGLVRVMTGEDYAEEGEQALLEATERGVPSRARSVTITSLTDGDLRGLVAPELWGQMKDRLADLGKNLAHDAAMEALGEVIDKLFRPLVQQIEDLRFKAQGLRDPDELYRIDAEGRLQKAADLGTSSKILLLLHGTWQPSEVGFAGLLGSHEWAALHDHFAGQVVTYQHRTLSRDPVQNAQALLKLLPTGARLHVLGSSRGGLIGELLCLEEDKAGILESILRDTLPPGEPNPRSRTSPGKLLALRRDKDIEVERFLRVACPTQGTPLLSRRLDRYLSAVFTVLSMAGVDAAVMTFLRTVAVAVLRATRDPRVVPGIAAMRPEDPLIAFLNHPRHLRTEKHALAIVAGDVMLGNSLRHSFGVLLGDIFFFRGRHDFVVPTPSMSGGLPRMQTAVRLFESTPTTSHASYFANDSTRVPLAAWLRGRPSGAFVPVDESGDGGGDRGGLRAAFTIGDPLRDPGPVDKNDPRDVVILVPGIMGSHLVRRTAAGDERLWFSYEAAWDARTLQLALGDHDGILADGAIRPCYGGIAEFLQERGLRVRVHAYDWRKDLLVLGDDLGKLVRKELAGSRRRVHLLAHSMGGLVIRGLIARQPKTWEEVTRRGGRLLMAGTPNEGSWAMLRMLLTGEHAVLEALNGLLRIHALLPGQEFTDLRHLVRRFPGVLELLPWTATYFQAAFWDDWRDDCAVGSGATDATDLLPLPPDLDAAKATWETLENHGKVPEGTIHLAGHAHWTPANLEQKQAPASENPTGKRAPTSRVVFVEEADAGDGTVTWRDGIPKKARVYYVRAAHDAILSHAPAFAGIADLLLDGETDQDQPQRTAPVTHWYGARGSDGGETGSRNARSVPAGDRQPCFPSEALLTAALLGQQRTEPGEEVWALPLAVTHGSLHAARWPVVVGHCTGSDLLGAEVFLDRVLGGELKKRLTIGAYPAGPGDCHAIQGAGGRPRAYIVGLGQPGELSPQLIEHGARSVVCRHGLDAAARGDPFGGLSFLLIGANTDISVRESVRAITRGALDAAQDLRDAGHCPAFDGIELIEIYEDRALEALDAIRDLDLDPGPPRGGGQVRVNALLRVVDGGMASAPSRTNDITWPQRVHVHVEDDGHLNFVLISRRAQAPERGTSPIWSGVDLLVGEVTKSSVVLSTERGRQLGEVLLKHLVPPVGRALLQRDLPLQLVLDRAAARIPWEFMQGDQGGPPVTRFPFTRQLSMQETRVQPIDARGQRAFVAADLEDGEYALPGAREEALRVGRIFEDHGWQVQGPVLAGEAACERLFFGLFSPSPTVLHIAAHGEAGENPGIVLPDSSASGPGKPRSRIRLTGAHLQDLDPLPKLVFLNACHSGFVTPAHAISMAPTMAEGLIAAGVQAVVVTGWPVHDLAAQTFATTFWEQMLAGRFLGEAARVARLRTWREHPEVNTWAAYQVYGDPGFRLCEAPRPRYAPPGSEREVLDRLAGFRNEYRQSAQQDEDLTAWRDAISGLCAATDRSLQSAAVCEAVGRDWREVSGISNDVGTMRDFRDLVVWQRGHRFTLVVYRATRAFPRRCVSDHPQGRAMTPGSGRQPALWPAAHTLPAAAPVAAWTDRRVTTESVHQGPVGALAAWGVRRRAPGAGRGRRTGCIRAPGGWPAPGVPDARSTPLPRSGGPPGRPSSLRAGRAPGLASAR